MSPSIPFETALVLLSMAYMAPLMVLLAASKMAILPCRRYAIAALKTLEIRRLITKASSSSNNGRGVLCRHNCKIDQAIADISCTQEDCLAVAAFYQLAELKPTAAPQFGERALRLCD